MKNDPKVSIIIPIYNVEKYIGACLKSVIDQTYKNIELILVNDASPDNSVSVAVETLKQASFEYKLIHNEQNSGPSITRNNGMQCASGEYITFVDSDDIINCCYIEHLVRAAQETSADLAMSDAVEIQNYSDADVSDTSFAAEKREIKNKSDILRQHGYPVGYLYKREIIVRDDLRFPPIRYMEDVLWNTEYLLNVNSIAFVPSAKYFYLKRPGSLSRPGSREKVAIRTYECACAFDEKFLLYGEKEQYAELLQDRRYVRNCYWGEISALNFRIPKECRTDKTNRKVLRKMIRLSDLSLKEKLQEYIMSVPAFEKLIYRLLMH